MICTEEEAKGKWCPFSRVLIEPEKWVGSTLPSFNRLGGKHPDDATNCVGAACMAWRRLNQGENYSENLSTGERTHVAPVGWCGLAGNPR